MFKVTILIFNAYSNPFVLFFKQSFLAKPVQIFSCFAFVEFTVHVFVMLDRSGFTIDRLSVYRT